MQQIPVIYWSGTGNTKAMAEAVAKGINDAGKEALLLSVSEISAEKASEYNVLALGCPSMGMEVLEEYEFEPFFTELEGKLNGKKFVLFGSYGWGGTYMQEWENRVRSAGGELLADGILALGFPDDEILAECMQAGKVMANC